MLPLPPHRFIAFLLVVYCSIFSSAVAQQSRRTASEIRFASDTSARDIPFELHNNHIYLHVGVNNSAPLSFILDTGASSAISRQRAESLGSRFRRRERGFGVGENSVEASIV